MTIYKRTKTYHDLSPQTKNTLGFTLIEFMVALAILAILLAVALPSFSYWMAKNESDYVTDLLSRQMQGAREHAINHNREVTLCGTNATGECVKTAFTKLVIFIDENANKSVQDSETVITETTLNAPRGSLTLKIGAVGDLAAIFKQDGSSSTASSYVYCPKNASYTQLRKKITLSNTGRSYVQPADATDCAI